MSCDKERLIHMCMIDYIMVSNDQKNKYFICQVCMIELQQLYSKEPKLILANVSDLRDEKCPSTNSTTMYVMSKTYCSSLSNA